MSEHEIADPFRHCLRVSVSALCTEVGFETAESGSLETLTELTASLLTEVGRSARAYCELAGRVEPVVADLVLALVELGIPMDGLREFAMRGGRVTLPAPAQAVPAKQTAILHTGNKRRHPLHIPEYLPEMPDSHSYIRTPTHRQPITDYESVREKGGGGQQLVFELNSCFSSNSFYLSPTLFCVKQLLLEPNSCFALSSFYLSSTSVLRQKAFFELNNCFASNSFYWSPTAVLSQTAFI